MVRDSSLVATNIAWKSSAAAADCLVTWEVSGGGKLHAPTHFRMIPTFSPLKKDRNVDSIRIVDSQKLRFKFNQNCG